MGCILELNIFQNILTEGAVTNSLGRILLVELLHIYYIYTQPSELISSVLFCPPKLNGMTTLFALSIGTPFF